MPLTPPVESGAASTRVRGAREPLGPARGERGERLDGVASAVCMDGGKPRSGGVKRSNGTRADDVDIGRGAAAPPVVRAVDEGVADEVAAEPVAVVVAVAAVGRGAAGRLGADAVPEGDAGETLACGATGSGR